MRYLTHTLVESVGSLLRFANTNSSLHRFPHCGNVGRYLSVQSSNGTFISSHGVEGEVQTVADVSGSHKLDKRNSFQQKHVIDIVDVVRNSNHNNREDLEGRLSMLCAGLSVGSITQVIGVLNTQKIPGMKFFDWIWNSQTQLHKNSNICSLMICNMGNLNDYDAMFGLLKRFTSERICLTHAAFSFIPVVDSTPSKLKESTKRVVDLLNKTGGSCRNSGVHALIEMLCKLDLFEMAGYVIGITESKESYYCLLIRHKCRRGLIDDAYATIREMKTAGCAISTTVYNYILGSLWKNDRMCEAPSLLDEMTEAGVHPDEITFEILVNHLCKSGAMDDVHQLLEYMVSRELKPRLSTHVSIIKSLFAAEKFDEASKHVDSCVAFRTSSNMLYSLLANLYRQKGDIIGARDTLLEMMQKSLKPNFRTYNKVVKKLKISGKANLAKDLENKHCEFAVETRTCHQ